MWLQTCLTAATGDTKQFQNVAATYLLVRNRSNQEDELPYRRPRVSVFDNAVMESFHTDELNLTFREFDVVALWIRKVVDDK